MKLLGVVAAMVIAIVGSASAQTLIDVGSDHVTCNSIIKSVVQFVPALSTTGATPLITKIKGALGGCTDSDNSGVHFVDGKSTFKGVITGSVNNCAGLAGASPASGSIAIKWKTVEKLVNGVSTVTINPNSTVSGTFTASWGALYGKFELGAPTGVALSVTGAFAGTDGGATSNSIGITTQDLTLILNGCVTPGIKSLNLGIGQIHLG
jgi:hypothetical protein